MTAKPKRSVFKDEAALCAAFIASVPEAWTCYPETAGFDILMVRKTDGVQIGIEAKMTLNAKVLLQAIERAHNSRGAEWQGPDFRAALVPCGTAGAELSQVARRLGVVVIQCRAPEDFQILVDEKAAEWGRYGMTCPPGEAEASAQRDWKSFEPDLPALDGYWWASKTWPDFCPVTRCTVPDYVPDVRAGTSAPVQLSEWKVKAIKICIVLERRGYVVPGDFKHIGIDRRRWMDMGWLKADTANRGRYLPGAYALNLRAAHPVNYDQVAADWEKWKPEEPAAVTGVLV